MNTYLVATAATLLLAFGCAGSHPAPTQQMADVQAANRSAIELGAQKNPRAQLHLKLAQEQMNQAKKAMENDDNAMADRLLTRAKLDAELAIALTRESAATHEASEAVDQSNAQTPSNAGQGALR